MPAERVQFLGRESIPLGALISIAADELSEARFRLIVCGATRGNRGSFDYVARATTLKMTRLGGELFRGKAPRMMVQFCGGYPRLPWVFAG